MVEQAHPPRWLATYKGFCNWFEVAFRPRYAIAPKSTRSTSRLTSSRGVEDEMEILDSRGKKLRVVFGMTGRVGLQRILDLRDLRDVSA